MSHVLTYFSVYEICILFIKNIKRNKILTISIGIIATFILVFTTKCVKNAFIQGKYPYFRVLKW
tara:strand:- start:4029 stop:4220 length:192 start_codon:yes stop_codon:yes gene_type:complete